MTNKYRVKAHFFPIKLLASSVMPVIFATAMLTLFSTISTVFNYNWNWVSYTTKQGFAVYVILIFLFSFIYNFIQIDGVRNTGTVQSVRSILYRTQGYRSIKLSR